MQVESTWIIYNRPKNNELTNEYAGFLMALGLNGHLPNLNTLNVHDYLSKVKIDRFFLKAKDVALFVVNLMKSTVQVSQDDMLENVIESLPNGCWYFIGFC